MYHTLHANLTNIYPLKGNAFFANHHVLSMHVKLLGGVPFGKLTMYWTIQHVKICIT